MANRSSRSALAIHLLGRFRVSAFGKTVDDSQWPRPQSKLLLKLLALDPKHQLHRQQIIDAIWPDLDAERGAAQLHKIIHLARRALEPRQELAADSQFILTRGQQVMLAAPGGVWIDSEQFEAGCVQAFRSGLPSDCENALALYAGDLLSDDLYADWCTRRRDQFRALYQELLMKLGGIYAAQGQYALAITRFESLVAAEPSNEEAHRELMRLYAFAGRRSDALRQFRRCSDAVRNELDALPEDATIQLYRRILANGIRPVTSGRDDFHEAAIETLAVLPFHNDTGDANLAYLSSGIAESLIKNLSQIPRLRVLAYSTVARYKGRDLNPRRLGRDLTVRALVTGRIARADRAFTITAELVDTSTGSVLWSQQYQSRQSRVLNIQEEISREITATLRVQMTVEERNRLLKRYTQDADAYTLYLKGRFHWNKRTATGLKQGIDYFEKAIQRDPSYVLVHSGLADCYSLLSLYSVMSPRQAMPRAKAAARKALALDQASAEAHTSLALTCLYYDWDWTAAEREFQCAIDRNPNYATAHHWYHEYLTAMGRFEDQLAEILRAQELDPLSLIINTDVGWGLYYARRFDEAIEQLRRTLELDANFAVAHLMLGLAYAQTNCLSDALASVKRAIELSSDTPLTLAIGALGYVLAISGKPAEARAVMQNLQERPEARYASDYCQSLVLAGLGEHAQAAASLENAFRQRYDRMIYLNVEPIFDQLRSNGRFRDLIRRMRF
jgi:DNA-binding SARP family transcriptional activator